MSLSVLIAENEEMVRKLILRILKTSGLNLSQVYEAENGAEGLKILTEQHVDFALVDLHMPVMSGEEMVMRIKQNADFRRVPIIFISGEECPRWIQSLEQKSLGFIQKPFTANTLAQTVVNFLSK